MSTQERSRQGIGARFKNVEPSQFSGEVEQLWEAARSYTELTSELVGDQKVTPYEGAKINAAIVASIFGVHELHPPGLGSPDALASAMRQ